MPPTPVSVESAKATLQKVLEEHHVVVFTDSGDESSARVCALLKSFEEPFEEVIVDQRGEFELRKGNRRLSCCKGSERNTFFKRRK